jgi:hypothetical protein
VTKRPNVTGCNTYSPAQSDAELRARIMRCLATRARAPAVATVDVPAEGLKLPHTSCRKPYRRRCASR